MPALHATGALLPSGWARDVLIEWNDAGVISRVTAGATPPPGAAIAAGPVLPGMPNVHSHSFQRAMAGLAERRGHPTDDFWTWREEMYRLVRLLEPEDPVFKWRERMLELFGGYARNAKGYPV